MNRLLIVKLSSIGDILHALPVVKSLKLDRPDLFIGWVVRQRCAGLLKGNDFIDQVHIVNDRPTLGDLVRLRKELGYRSYDTVFDMQGLFLSGLITALAGAKRRVGLNRNRELNALFLTDASVEGKTPLKHAVDVQLGFRKAAGLGPVLELPALLHLGRQSTEWWDEQRLSTSDRKTVVLNVGASTVYKRWPVDRWTGLAQLLIADGCHVVLTAGPSEADDADIIATAVDRPHSLTNLGGNTSADQLAAVLANSDVVVTGDTGPMHLAAAVGTPTVALFGPTDPRLTGPYGSSHVVIWKQLACSPCFRHPTCHGRVDCLNAITVEEVFSNVLGVLSRLKDNSISL